MVHGEIIQRPEPAHRCELPEPDIYTAGSVWRCSFCRRTYRATLSVDRGQRYWRREPWWSKVARGARWVWRKTGG